jgi:mRNA interferase RelE/StbE
VLTELRQRALNIWKKLDDERRGLLVKKLEQRLINPRVPVDKLYGFKNCYKIKLCSLGYCFGVIGVIIMPPYLL